MSLLQPALPGMAPAARHDAGGAKRWPMRPGVRGSAVFHGARDEYRLLLWRKWGPEDGPYLLSIGCNPSTASATVDDPTIRIDIAIAKRAGFTSMLKVNICDLRATDPKTLRDKAILPRSDANLRTIVTAAANAGLIFLCLGSMHPSLRGYADSVVALLADRELWCLGVNADLSPKHPLYVASDTPLQRFRPPRSVPRAWP